MEPEKCQRLLLSEPCFSPHLHLHRCGLRFMRTPTLSMHQLFTDNAHQGGRQQEPACQCGCFKTNKASSKAATLIRGLAVIVSNYA